VGGEVTTINPEPVTVDVFDRYQPMPKQAEFHAAPGKYRFFGGGFGNGKTSAGCAEALALALEYPGSTGLIARKTRPELIATTMHTFFNGGGGDPDAGDFTGCPEALIKRHNKSQSRIELINGSIIWYWPLDDPDKLTNLNLGWFLIDQAEEVPEEMFMMLQGRLRQVRAPRKGILLFNPNGHDWIWRRCVFLKGAYRDHTLIHAKTSDNFNLPSDYIEQFKGYPEAWKKRFFDGSFDVFTDQIWPEYDPEVHEIRPVPLESWWEVVEGIDHGRRNPTAVLWAAFFSQYGHDYCFVVEEHYEAGKRVKYHAKKILETRKELRVSPMWTVIDASAAQKDPNTERSVIDEYWDHGVHTIPSDRHKLARIVRVAEWLSLDEAVPHPLTGELRPEGWPRMYFFKTLTHLKEHVPQYRWKPQPPTQIQNAPEEALKKDDHDVDALGYILMMRPQPGKSPTGPDHSDPRSQKYWDRYRERTNPRSKTRTGVD
jgi:hypothetical protein